jgi:hypothetical protein
MWTAMLIIPGLLAAYFLLVRPLLRKLPAFQKFYAEADGFWQSVWAVCGKSITMAWSYMLIGAGALLSQLDSIAATLGDPNFKAQVADFLHSDPKYLGYFAMMVSAVTIASRLRSIGRGQA